MKVVKNSCYGGFGLSPLAIKRLAELQEKKCFFFKSYWKLDEYKQVTMEEADRLLMFTAFSVENPNEVLGKSYLKDGTYKEFNAKYAKISIDIPEDRSDPLLVKVVEELGEKANTRFSELEVVEIPDGVDFEIDEYDGFETIHETHRSW